MTNEQKVNDIRKQKSFLVKIGGKDIEMSPLNLSRLDDMSALSSLLPVLEGGDKVKASDIFALPGCGKALAKIFFLSAKPSIKVKWYQKPIRLMLEKKAFNQIYKEMSFEEMQAALLAIFENSQLFFYIDCIISLRGMNRLKETKETEATVHGY